MKTSSSFAFPVSLIKHYLFCPRIPYFILFLGAHERVTENMREGKEEHEKFFRRERRKGRLVNIFLESEKYGIYGFVDEILKEDNGYCVVELKNTEYRKENMKIHLYQAVAYALLVEENFGRVVKIVLKYKDKSVEMPLTAGMRKYVVSIINKITKMQEEGLAPSIRNKTRCQNCGFSKICMEYSD